MTKQEVLDRLLKERRDHQKRLEAIAQDICRVNTEIEREKTFEVTQDCAPNHAKEWSGFEQDQLEGKLAQFVYDRARLAGRTTSSIRHRIVEIIAPTICGGKMHEMARGEMKPKTEKKEYRSPERRAGVTGFMVFGV